MLHEQAVEVTAADARARGDAADVDIAGIVVVDEPDGLLDILVPVAERRRRPAEAVHQRGEEQQQPPLHARLVARAGAGGIADVHHLFAEPGPGGVEDRLPVEQTGLLHQPLGVRAVEADPAVLPRVVAVRRVKDDLRRNHQEAVLRREGILLPAAAEHAVPGNDDVDQIMVAHGRPPRVARAAFLHAAAVDRQPEAVVERNLKRPAEFIVRHAPAPPFPPSSCLLLLL